MGETSMVHIRVDDDLKRDAAAALDAIGLSMSDAVRILLKRVVAEQAMPLELKVPNAVTRAAIMEARAKSARFASSQDLLDDLAAE